MLYKHGRKNIAYKIIIKILLKEKLQLLNIVIIEKCLKDLIKMKV